MLRRILIEKYWTDGCHFRNVVSENSFIQVMPGHWNPEIEIRSYQSGIEDCFDDRWTPCTQDEFVIAYCNVINRISAVSGIEHLPLKIEEATNAG